LDTFEYSHGVAGLAIRATPSQPPQRHAQGLLEAIERLLAVTRSEELPALIGRLEVARARALARLCEPLEKPPISPDPLDLLRVEDAARLLKVNVWTLRDAIRRGKLPIVHIGRLHRLRRADLEAFLAER
jgi:excisionase family DNA binding protein